MATTYSTYRLGAVDSLKMPPHFSVHVYYDQTAGWIGIPLEVGLGPGDIVLGHCVRWGHSFSSTQSGRASPTFRPTALACIPAGPHFIHNPYCGLTSARRAALVAILPDNCHPSGFYFHFWLLWFYHCALKRACLSRACNEILS